MGQLEGLDRDAGRARVEVRAGPLDRKGPREGEATHPLAVRTEQLERDRATLLRVLGLKEPLQQRVLVRDTPLEREVRVLEPAAQLVLEAVLAAFLVGLDVVLHREARALGEPAELDVVDRELEAKLADGIRVLGRRRRAAVARLLVRGSGDAGGFRGAEPKLAVDSDRHGWQLWQ